LILALRLKNVARAKFSESKSIKSRYTGNGIVFFSEEKIFPSEKAQRIFQPQCDAVEEKNFLSHLLIRGGTSLLSRLRI
jgi:hypothetical protein